MRYANKIISTFLYFLFLLPTFAFSQKPEGISFIRNYSPKEYGTSSDNWAIAQDRRGIMYFGNASGVLEYDGINWKLIPVSNTSLVRSIAIDSTGMVYIGAVGEFGFIAPNEKGIMTYHSLIEKLPKEERDFADVWKTHITPEGIYFQTFTKLIRINNNSVKIWKPETAFHFSFVVNNKLYINEREKGLKEIANNEIVLVNGGEIFSGIRIYSMLPYPGNKILIATREKGFALMNEKTSEKNPIHFWDVEANKNLINDQIYQGTALKNERYAFATLQNGVLITDIKGNIEQILNKQNGLTSDIVNAVNINNQNDLWVAQQNGISRVEISSPLHFLHDAQGLNGSIWDIISFRGSLYVATSLGLFKAIDDRFIPISGISSQTWSLKIVVIRKDSFLLAASEAGIYKIENTTASLLKDGFGYTLYQSKTNSERIFIGMSDGLSSLRCENGNWINEDYINGIDKEIRSIAEDNNGDLWLGTPFDGLIKVDFTDNTTIKNSLVTTWNKRYKIYTYDTNSGLPDMKYNIPYNFKNKIAFATYKGIYEFDEQISRFAPSHLLSTELQESQVYRFAPKDSSTIWMVTVAPSGTKETGIAYLQKDNTYSWYSIPFGKIRESEIHAIFPDENGITWLGGPDGLLRYDENVKKDFSQSFYAHLRKVIIGKDSLIFGGTFYAIKDSFNIPVLSQEKFLTPTISFSNNSLRFEYSTTSFGDEQSNEFSIYLEGFDEGWSGWSTKNLKEYTNLKEGNYIFHLKAKNIYGTESIESTYTFIISPPWYRTVWAYIGYVIAFICFVYIIIQLSVRRLVRTKMILEKTVKERTEEVVKQKEEVEIQKQIVEHKNKDITDSINYAQRIQRALLASDQLLKNNLPEYFIFFQPKDIVSGDFYWASKLSNDQFALVTADSTGHGVPGAIMSMLNISCLNEAINGQKLTEPKEILNYTRSKIIEHLANDGSAEGGKDGMDCSLISFDLKKNKLIYSAANNPVWIIRSKEILEFDPDKLPVGKHDNDSISFTQHSIELQQGDVIYVLTDGLPDQFGGTKGKKFMYKQLKELLLRIAHLPMDGQREALKSAFNNWKGDLEQVDDVCVIGVRIK